MSEKKENVSDWDGYRDYWKALFMAIKGVGEAKADRSKHLKKKVK